MVTEWPEDRIPYAHPRWKIAITILLIPKQ